MSGLITQGELDTTLNKKINDSDTNSKLNKQQIGSLPSLRTNSKDTLVNSINELFQYASNGKTLVANAITGKGVQSNGNMSFQQLATNISNIKTGYSREDLESGKVVVKGIVDVKSSPRTNRFKDLKIKIYNDTILLTGTPVDYDENMLFYNMELEPYTDTSKFDPSLFKEISLSPNDIKTNHDCTISWGTKGMAEEESVVYINISHKKLGTFKSYSYLNKHNPYADHKPICGFYYNGFGYILFRYPAYGSGPFSYQLKKYEVKFEVTE